MEPFSLTCATCQTRLRVRDEAALGKILSCPRCGSMVRVEDPNAGAIAAVGAQQAEQPAVEGTLESSADSGLDLTVGDVETGRRRWPLVGGALAGLLLVVLALLYFATSGTDAPAPDVAAADPQPAAVPAAPDDVPPAEAVPAAEPAPEPAPSDEPAAEPPPEPQPSDARAIDEANHERSAAALGKHHEEHGAYPVGAAGAVQLPAEERLSWIATLLPYYDRGEWHAALNFRRSWNDPQNRPVTTQPLDAVVNPALTADAPSDEPAGDDKPVYPPTHYVGVAGIGEDAAALPAEHPRAGLFGHARTVRSENVKDGLSNTIAVLGASGDLGPWSAGGRATVRPLTQAPYVNGADGFGSGTPDGVVAGMADGSARFVSKDVDPRVLEQMATIAGGERPPTETELAGPPMAPPGAPEAAPTDQPPADASQPAGTPVAASDVPALAAEAAPAVSDEEARAAAEARLADPLLEIEFTDVALAEFIEFMSQLSTLRITLDFEALTELAVTPDSKLSVKQSATTFGEALAAGLAELGLSYAIYDGQLIVTNPRRQAGQLREVRYRVGDLTGGSRDQLADLAALVEAVVEPASWSSTGGAGTIQLVADAFVVRQNDAAHFQTLVLCEKLRVARGKPPASGGDRTRFALTSRTEQARELLDAPLTANFSEAKLSKVLSYVQERSGANVHVDWLALAAQGMPREVQAELKVERAPLADALEQLLAPLELSYRVVGPRAIEITTRRAAAEHRELEIYPVRDLLAAGDTPLQFVTRLSTAVQPPSGNGAPASPLVVRFDEPSASVLVLAPQELQRQAEQLLAGWRAERTDAAKPVETGSKPADAAGPSR